MTVLNFPHNTAAQPLPRSLPVNLEAEQAVLGAIMLQNECVKAMAHLQPEHFSEELHQRIFSLCLDIIKDGKLATPLTVKTFLYEHDIGGMTTMQYLAKLAAHAIPPSTAPHYAKLLIDLHTRRTIIGTINGYLDAAYDAPADTAPAIIAASAGQQLMELSRTGTDDTSRVESGTAALALVDRGEAIRRGEVIRECCSTGFKDIDAATGGYEAGLFWIIGARPSMGKAQPLNAKIRTLSGWKRMGDIAVGDKIASMDGAPSVVTGVFPQERKAVHLISFSDGRSVEACADHLWTVHYRSWNAPRVLTTSEIIEKLTRKRYRNRLWIEQVSGDLGDIPDVDLPLHPWVLGALLGNGCCQETAVSFSGMPDENVERLKRLLPDGVTLKNTRAFQYNISGPRRGGVNIVLDALRGLGLAGVKSPHKFVPKQYLTASRAQRLALLQGLMDTDGWVEKQGAVQIAVSSPFLAEDIVELARSLGFWAKMARRRAFVHKNGQREQKSDSYKVGISGQGIEQIFTLPRKLERLGNRSRKRILTIERVEFSRFDECQCISVSHPSRLYVTDDYILTHNTTFAISSAARVAGKAMRGEDGGAGVLFFSLEDDEKQATARLLSMSCYSQTSPIEYRQILAAKDLDDYAFQRLRRNAEKLADYPLTMDFASRPTVEQVAYKIRLEKDRMAKRGYRLGVVFIDYLKKMQASGRYQGNRNLEFGEITGKLKDVCRDEQVCIVLFSQLNRATEQSQDKRPTLANLRDSGEIEEDGNVVCFLHRENYYITRSPEYKQHDDVAIQRALDTERELEFLIEKNKSGPIGSKKLFVDLASNYIADYEQWRTA